MSSMDVDLDKSLDEIAASRRSSNSNNRRGRRGSFNDRGGSRKIFRGGIFKGDRGGSNNSRGGRSSPYHQHHRPIPGGNIDASWRHDLYYEAGTDDNSNNTGSSRIFININSATTGAAKPSKRQDKSLWGEYPGPTVRVSNIHWNVSEGELLELCQFKIPDCQVLDLKLLYDSAGRSEGIADITFARNEDAELCVQEWNGLAIDELYVDVKLHNPPPQAALPISQRLGKPINIAARLGPVNVDTSAILTRLGGRVGGSGKGVGRGGGRGASTTATTGRAFADAVQTDSRTILNYEETHVWS